MWTEENKVQSRGLGIEPCFLNQKLVWLLIEVRLQSIIVIPAKVIDPRLYVGAGIHHIFGLPHFSAAGHRPQSFDGAGKSVRSELPECGDSSPPSANKLAQSIPLECGDLSPPGTADAVHSIRQECRTLVRQRSCTSETLVEVIEVRLQSRFC